MPGYLLTVNSTLLCPHAGKFNIITSNARVKLSGQLAVTQQDTYTITACPFTTPAPASLPHPCITAKWLMVSTRVKIGGKFAVLKDSIALCQAADQAPQGSPNIVPAQMRVKGQ
ncbi:MAG: DUF4280 domain-containing protein [Candidatus Bathyarchaeota archaeon]|jgi:hypothetical protein|uniref:hypothetical protein n=1 Tax=Candidatus Bathycorpusculum sp. TaxID=2994959 RepID=UPI00281CA6AC|nr:DUF4280 domain-containing protein [Candidatus Termiticorpusculum sp.]MCL2257114.1 DUF4280 domain-containing protein [Candidatus Termiticorpusculum sp.]MCL2292746.1 DUF4280 domain-containing protein [Candidatus Termiticorpusculum sp.]